MPDMHGLIFVTWEKYLCERYSGTVLKHYREEIGETAATSPLASRTYGDEVFLKGGEVPSKLPGNPLVIMSWEKGGYLLLNGLTGHPFPYFPPKVKNGPTL